MRTTIARLLVASTPFVLGACSLLITRGPPAGHKKMMTGFSCTEDWTAPALDVALTVFDLAYVNAIANDPDAGGTPSPIVAAVFAVSAGLGFVQVSRCKAALRALTLRQAEAAAADRRRKAALIAVQKVSITGPDTLTVATWTQFAASAYDSTGAVIVDKVFAWSSSDDRVARVSSEGLVTAWAVGTAVITASASNVIGMANIVVVPDH